VPDGTWGLSAITASAGSGTAAFGPGSWSAYFYDLEQYGTCGGATDAQRAEKAMLGQTFPTGPACDQNLGETFTPYGGGPVTLSEIDYTCGTGAIPHPDGTCSATSWKTGYDHFAIKFVRSFTVPLARQYDLSVTHNDGAQLYIYPAGPHTNPLINGWTDTEPLTPTDGAVVTLNPGAYTIEVWYYDNTGGATIVLDAAVPSFSFHDSPAGDYAYLDDMSVTLGDRLINLTGHTQPVLSWYEQYDLADDSACIVPEVSLPYVSFDNWIAVAEPLCGPLASTGWQLRQEALRAPIENRLGPVSFTGDSALLAVRFRLYALSATTGDGWWIDDITVGDPNNAPVAGNDAYTTAEDTPLSVPAPGVLGNDSDPDGNPLAAALASGPAHGSVTLNADGSFTYTPLANYNGADSFTYTASDGKGGTATATVSITITAVNDPPVAANDSYSVGVDSSINVSAPGVLGNDSDVEGSPLTAALVSGPTNGTLTLNANGSFSYAPNAGYTGPDSFTYRANDGAADSNVATVTITVS